MKKVSRILLICFIAVCLLTGCGKGGGTKDNLVTIEYRNSSYNFDEKNKIIPIEGYELNQLYPYDTKETEEGLEITFYFNKKLGIAIKLSPLFLCKFHIIVS